MTLFLTLMNQGGGADSPLLLFKIMSNLISNQIFNHNVQSDIQSDDQSEVQSDIRRIQITQSIHGSQCALE